MLSGNTAFRRGERAALAPAESGDGPSKSRSKATTRAPASRRRRHKSAYTRRGLAAAPARQQGAPEEELIGQAQLLTGQEIIKQRRSPGQDQAGKHGHGQADGQRPGREAAGNRLPPVRACRVDAGLQAGSPAGTKSPAICHGQAAANGSRLSGQGKNWTVLDSNQ